MSKILALDPGNVRSAFVILDTERQLVLEKELLENEACIEWFRHNIGAYHPDVCVIEQIAGMGMAVGETVFETAVWSGRFMQYLILIGYRVERIKRNPIKILLCGTPRAKDPNVRQRLIDIFGAPGTKKIPGKTYGMKADMWAALAVAVAWDMQEKEKKCVPLI